MQTACLSLMRLNHELQPFFALNQIFFPANEKALRNHNNLLAFKVF